MNVTRSLLDDTKTEQLQWYGHVQRMVEIAKKFMKWSPQGRGKRGRPKRTWAEGTDGGRGVNGRRLK